MGGGCRPGKDAHVGIPEATIRRVPKGTMSVANCAGLGGFAAHIHTVQFATLIGILQTAPVFRVRRTRCSILSLAM